MSGKRQMTDGELIHDGIEKEISQCQCRNQFRAEMIDEGKYRVRETTLYKFTATGQWNSYYKFIFLNYYIGMSNYFYAHYICFSHFLHCYERKGDIIKLDSFFIKSDTK